MIIYIYGLPRTGKTTLAKKLKNSISASNIIVSEAIRNAFQKIDITHAKEWGRKNSKLRQETFPIFVQEFMTWNESFSNNITILDCALISLKTIINMSKKNDIIICLGFGSKDNKKIFKAIREYEHEGDYSKQYSDEELLNFLGDLEAQDIENQELCKISNIRYFDTSCNREKIQDKIIEYVVNEVNKEIK